MLMRGEQRRSESSLNLLPGLDYFRLMRKTGGLGLTGIIAVITAFTIGSVACRPDRSSSTSPANSPSPSPTAQQLALINDLRKLAETQCGAKADAIDVDASLLTQGCDELDVVELIMMVEDKYNITIPDIEGERVTVNSLARIIDKR
jgi:acyl carrier protein